MSRFFSSALRAGQYDAGPGKAGFYYGARKNWISGGY